jgi:hypothetical protein
MQGGKGMYARDFALEVRKLLHEHFYLRNDAASA